MSVCSFTSRLAGHHYIVTIPNYHAHFLNLADTRKVSVAAFEGGIADQLSSLLYSSPSHIPWQLILKKDERVCWIYRNLLGLWQSLG